MKREITLRDLTDILEQLIEDPELSATKTKFVSVSNILAFCKQLNSLKAIFVTEPTKSEYTEDVESLILDFEESFVSKTVRQLEKLGVNLVEKNQKGSKTILIQNSQQDAMMGMDPMMAQMYGNPYQAQMFNRFAMPPQFGMYGYGMPPQYAPYPQQPAPQYAPYPQQPAPQYAPAPAPTPAPAPAPTPAPAPAPTPAPAPAPAPAPTPTPAPAPAPAPAQSDSLSGPVESSSSSSSNSNQNFSFNLGGGDDKPAAGRDYLLSLLSK